MGPDLGSCSVLRVEEVATDVGLLEDQQQSFWSHTSTLVGHKIYVIGGMSQQSLYREAVHLLDTTTWRWEAVALENVRINGANTLAFLVRDTLYICGATLQGSDSRTWAFDLTLGAFELYETARDELVPRGDAAGEYVEALDEIVVYGGFGTTAAKHLVALDLQSRVWRIPVTKGAPPPCRHSQSSCLHGIGDVYFFGGNEGEELHPHDDIFLLQCRPASYTWSQPLWILKPDAHANAIMGCARNRIFIFGGYSSSGSRKSNELFVGDINTHTGYRLIPREIYRKNLPVQLIGSVPELANHSAVCTNDRLVVLGGQGCPDNTVYVISPYR